MQITLHFSHRSYTCTIQCILNSLDIIHSSCNCSNLCLQMSFLSSLLSIWQLGEPVGMAALLTVLLRYHCILESCSVFTKCFWLSGNEEMFYLCLTFGSILLVSWALINTLALFILKMSNVVQKCPPLIRKTFVNVSNVLKNFVNTACHSQN